MYLAQLNCVQWYLGQILLAIEKCLILQIVAFMPGLSKFFAFRKYIVAIYTASVPDKFLKIKFWKSLSNSKTTFNVEKVENLLRNANINPKNGVAYKKNVYLM